MDHRPIILAAASPPIEIAHPELQCPTCGAGEKALHINGSRVVTKIGKRLKGRTRRRVGQRVQARQCSICGQRVDVLLVKSPSLQNLESSSRPQNRRHHLPR